MKNAYLSICYLCNENCSFCPCSKGEKSQKMITDIDELKSAVDIFKMERVDDVTVSGGEPTLHPDLINLIVYIQSLGMTVTLLSNSERFSDYDFVNTLKNNINTSAIKVITTVHSGIAIEHENSNRTKGSFERTILGIHNLTEIGIRVIIKHCITGINYKNLMPFYRYCDDNFDESVDVQLCSIDYCGIPESSVCQEKLTFKELRPFLEELFDYHIERKKGGDIRKLYCINIPLCSCDVFYWGYFPIRRRQMYDKYKDPHNREMKDVHDNVGIHNEYCKGCDVSDICNGTYFSAYDVVGSNLVNPIYTDKCEQVYFPEFFMIDMTDKCNMNCKYCLRNVNHINKSISHNTIIDICNYIVKYCDDNSIENITIQPWGGEPLIELDKILLMRKVISPKKTKVHFSIETNATLLNDTVIETLFENRIGLGISIDGYQQIHDMQRIFPNGNGTHNIVEKNLLMAQKLYGSRLGTITTITKKTAHHIEEILEYYAIKLNLRYVKFNYVHNSMFSECKELCMSKEDIADTEIRLLNKLVELNERGYQITEHNIKVKLKNLLYNQYSDICNSCGCHGGRKMIVFDMDGDIFPCELTDIPSEKIGSIYNGMSLPDMVAEAVGEYDFFMEKREEKCDKCSWYKYCKGGCTVRTISNGKRPPCIDEIECAVNTSLYPALTQLILNNKDFVDNLVKM